MEPLASRIQDLTADILTGIVDGVIVIAASREVLIWNRAAEEMTGVAATDALGKNIAFVLSDNPAVVGLIEKTFTSGRSYSDYEAELHVKHLPRVPWALSRAYSRTATAA
jgi:PAS domain S-box-containing protein